jgi:hypothetical protein
MNYSTQEALRNLPTAIIASAVILAVAIIAAAVIISRSLRK